MTLQSGIKFPTHTEDPNGTIVWNNQSEKKYGNLSNKNYKPTGSIQTSQQKTNAPCTGLESIKELSRRQAIGCGAALSWLWLRLSSSPFGKASRS